MCFHMPNTSISFGEETWCGICESLSFVLSSHPAVLIGWKEGLNLSHYSWLLGSSSFLTVHKLKEIFVSLSLSVFLSLSLFISIFFVCLSLPVYLTHMPPPPRSPSSFPNLFPTAFFNLSVIWINSVTFCACFVPLCVIQYVGNNLLL